MCVVIQLQPTGCDDIEQLQSVSYFDPASSDPTAFQSHPRDQLITDTKQGVTLALMQKNLVSSLALENLTNVR
jgi:hypothetical protein